MPDGVPAARGDGYFYFKGIGDIRFRQPVTAGSAPPNVKDPEKDLVLRIAARVRIFDLSNVDDLGAYQRVLNDCANGHAEFGESEKQYDPEKKTWRVFLRWYELFHEPRRPF